jgi:hypothetical protein
MTSQVRIYTINKGKLNEFVKAWNKGVVPLRLRHGFKIGGAWTVKENNQFVWILTYDDPEDWHTKQEVYYNSPERKALDPDPAQYIARVQEYFISSIKIEAEHGQ